MSSSLSADSTVAYVSRLILDPTILLSFFVATLLYVSCFVLHVFFFMFRVRFLLVVYIDYLSCIVFPFSF